MPHTIPENDDLKNHADSMSIACTLQEYKQATVAGCSKDQHTYESALV